MDAALGATGEPSGLYRADVSIGHRSGQGHGKIRRCPRAVYVCAR